MLFFIFEPVIIGAIDKGIGYSVIRLVLFICKKISSHI